MTKNGPLTGKALLKYEIEQRKACDAWPHPEGTPVIVRKDDGTVIETKTRSAPWMLCGTAVVLLEGISGGYSLDRVTPVG